MATEATLLSQPQALVGAEETRQRILEAALGTFSRHGYDGATTRAIAAAAGVNEVTLFRHFGNKQNLLAAVIEHYSALAELRLVLQREMTGDYVRDLGHMAQHFYDALVQRREVVWLMIREANRHPHLRQVFTQVPSEGRRLMAEYLRHQMEQGTVRRMDPGVATESFFAIFVFLALAGELIEEMDGHGLDPQALVGQFVDIFVRGTLDGAQAGHQG